MQILAIADDDSLLCRLEGVRPDVLIALGDLMDAAILRAIDFYAPRMVFGVRGNHDVASPFPAGIIDLHCRVHTFEGVRFGGFEGSWKYKPRGHHLYEQAEAASLLRDFSAVDVFATHNSPAGVHERDTHVHQGFGALADYLDRCAPRCMLHGHQHMDRTTILGASTIVGVFGERLIELSRGE